MDQIDRVLAELQLAYGELAMIEDQIAMIALATTEPERKHRVHWVDAPRYVRDHSDGANVELHPRAIACWLVPLDKQATAWSTGGL